MPSLIRLIYAAAFCTATTACTSNPQDQEHAMTKQSNLTSTCIKTIDFTDSNESSQWRVVNDNVMGGRSDGSFSITNSQLRFAGFINTNGGGFSSIRRAVTLPAMNIPQQVKLRVKTRNHLPEYRLIIHTNQSQFINHRAPLPLLETDDWQELSIKLSDLVPSRFGRVLDGPKLGNTDIRSIGLMRTSKSDGEFELLVDWIKVCR